MAKTAKKQLTANQRKQVVNKIIADSPIFDEKDRDVLTNMSSQKLVGILEQTVITNKFLDGELEAKGEQTTNQETKPDGLFDAMPDLSTVQGKVEIERVTVNGANKFKVTLDGKPYEQPKNVTVLNQNQPPQNLAQWLATVPPEARGIVQNALNAQQRQKEDLITQITNNANNQFTKEFLQTQPVEVLTGLARLAGATQPHYTGAGVLNPPTTNHLEDSLEDEEPLTMPTLNFSELAAPGLVKAKQA